jgi:Leucine-rich repeat (LRR) protein
MKRVLLIFYLAALFAACSDEEKASPYLILTPETLEFEDLESIQKIYIGSNTNWATASSADWCSVSIIRKFGSDTAEIKVLRNISYDERIAYVEFANPEKTIVKTVKVIQKPINNNILRSEDSAVLVKFYDAMNGDQWTNKSGWKDAALENWHGITVKNGRITGITMENNNLSGELIPELKDLIMLDTLSLVAESGINGNLPEIALLSNLVYLNISGTSISDSISPQTGNPAKLETLILYGNPNFRGKIPPELGNLSNLKTLRLSNLSHNDAIPSALARLGNLRHLALDSCKLNGVIHDDIFGMINLEYLSLSNNRLSGTIPPKLAELRNLKHLILSRNDFTGEIPSALEELTLLSLYLDGNYLDGTIPLQLLNIETFAVCPQKGGPGFDNYACNN